ncbi:hypothetical protein PBS_39120 [Paraburkholderia sp. 2C]
MQDIERCARNGFGPWRNDGIDAGGYRGRALRVHCRAGHAHGARRVDHVERRRGERSDYGIDCGIG